MMGLLQKTVSTLSWDGSVYNPILTTLMKGRNINDGLFGWYEKWAMKLIEDRLDRKQQASCKLIYIAICSFSAKSGNANEIECYKFDLARFASVSERTVQRYLPDLEKIGLIKVSPQDRMSDGRYSKIRIWLAKANPSAGHMEESSRKVRGKFADTKSDIYKEKKERKERNVLLKKFDHPAVENLWKTITTECEELKMENKVKPHLLEKIYKDFSGSGVQIGALIKTAVFHYKDSGKRHFSAGMLRTFVSNQVEWNKEKEIKNKQRMADKAANAGVKRSDLPQNFLDKTTQAMSWN